MCDPTTQSQERARAILGVREDGSRQYGMLGVDELAVALDEQQEWLVAVIEKRPRPTPDACPVCDRLPCPDCERNDWPPCEREPDVCHRGEPCARRWVDWRARLLAFDAEVRIALRHGVSNGVTGAS